MNQKGGHLRRVPAPIVQDDHQEWNVIASGDPVDTLHLREEVYSVSDSETMLVSC
jgi:hypothetical protein